MPSDPSPEGRGPPSSRASDQEMEASLSARVQTLADAVCEEQLKQWNALSIVEEKIARLCAFVGLPEVLAPNSPSQSQPPAEEADGSLWKQVSTLRQEVDAVKTSEDCRKSDSSRAGVHAEGSEGSEGREAAVEPAAEPMQASRALQSLTSDFRAEVLQAVKQEQEAFRDRYLLDATNCAETVKNLELTMGHVSTELNKLLQRVGGLEDGSPSRVLCNSSKTTLQGATFEAKDDVSPAGSPGKESLITELGGLESSATCAPLGSPGLINWSTSQPSTYAGAVVSPPPVQHVQRNIIKDTPGRCSAPPFPTQYAQAQPGNMWRRSVGPPSGHPSVPTPPPPAPFYFRSRSHDGAPAPPAQDRVVVATTKTASPIMAQEQTATITPTKTIRAGGAPQMVKDPFRDTWDAKLPVSRATIAVPFARDWQGQAMPHLLNVAVRSNGAAPPRASNVMRVAQVQTRVV
mmetsp:Transcript_26703/g.50174  ORF Transcript_26703/g.50174 Transcript_26703/m.50174 type:complete len:461 (+) Transcript_26703:34-1416(+)